VGKPVAPSTTPVARNPEREPPAKAEGLESKGRMVQGGGFENLQGKNNDSSEDFDVIDISRLKRVGE